MPDLRFLDASPALPDRAVGAAARAEPDEDAGWFFNCVVAIETDADARRPARRGCRTSSEALGRARRGPARRRTSATSRRPLDIDILLYDDRVISGPEHLHIPHLLMHERRVRPASPGRPRARSWSTRCSTRPSGAAGRAGGRARGAAVGPAAPVVRRSGPPRAESVADDEFRQQALQHLDALHNLAVYLTRNGSEAEDLVQETYVRAIRFSHRFQPGTHLRAWLFQILRNTFLTFYRLREREAALSRGRGPGRRGADVPRRPRARTARAPGPTWIWSGPWRSCRRSSRRRSCWPRSRGWRWRTWRASWTARWAR